MEPIAIQKATPGLDQSDAVGAIPGVQGTVAPELFEALLAQALPINSQAETAGIPGATVVPNTAITTTAQAVEGADAMVAALSAASLTAQRGMQTGTQTDTASPALVAVTPADTTDATPALTVSVPTVDSKNTDAIVPQLVVKTNAVNHELIARVTVEQTQKIEAPVPADAAQIDTNLNVEALAPVAEEPAAEAPVHNMPPAPHPLAAKIMLQPGEVYGPQRPAPVAQSEAVEAVMPKQMDIASTDTLEDHVTVKLEANDDSAPVANTEAQVAMVAQFATHVQIIEARVVTTTSDDLHQDDASHDEDRTADVTASITDAPRADTPIFVIDPALAAELTVKAPPANMVSSDIASEPDFVHHRRATIDAPVVLVKQAETMRSETLQNAAPTPAPRQIDETSEPVITYTQRQTSHGNNEGFGGKMSQHQDEPHREPAQKSNPTFTRANSASVKQDGMTITSDAVLARVEDATLDIRSLAKFNVREVEVSLANPMKVETNTPSPAPVVTDTTVVTRNDPQGPQQTQSTSSGDDARRAAANDVRLRALERMVVNAAREGSDTIKMQLYPPGLGQVIIRLNMEGSRLRLSTRTSNAEATEALRNLEQGLRDALSTSGLDLTQFDVSEDRQERERTPAHQAEQTQPKRGGFSDEVFAIDMNA